MVMTISIRTMQTMLSDTASYDEESHVEKCFDWLIEGSIDITVVK